MSCYVHEKVLRVPFDKLDHSEFEKRFDLTDPDWVDMLDIDWDELFDYGVENRFQRAPTEKFFIDYVLHYDSDCDDGEWYKSRDLSVKEQEKFRPIFYQLDPDIDMSNVKLVEFCWYNCSEAPDYYDPSCFHDPFYDEL